LKLPLRGIIAALVGILCLGANPQVQHHAQHSTERDSSRTFVPGRAGLNITQAFWDRFSKGYVSNCLAWHHSAHNPVLPPSGDAWQKRWTANPDLLNFDGKTFLYYRGDGPVPTNDSSYHDQIGVAKLTGVSRGTISYTALNNQQPIVRIGKKGSFDDGMVLDPSAVNFHSRVFLYYSAIGTAGYHIGLAVSGDGIHFKKLGPVIQGRVPSAIVHGDTVYLLFQRLVGLTGRGPDVQIRTPKVYEVYLARSTDGIHFEEVQSQPVFKGNPGDWDALSITTARVSYSDGWYYLLYGGSAYLADEPDYFGLARSRDLIHWERHPGNPIFGAGARGEPDGGAIWFPAFIDAGDYFAILYEGSRGKYSWDLSSTICMSWISKNP
jgi:predicted GH43/DUF377 family glycosyl hydrolase